MKHIYKMLIVLLFTSLTACEDYLDMVPSQEFSEEDVYETYYTAQSYLDNCYRALYDFSGASAGGMGVKQIETITDNACTQSPNAAFNLGDWYNKGSMQEVGWALTKQNGDNATGSGLPIYNASFCLRIANNLIENIETIPAIGATQEQKDWLMGQAYFFRAWYYFEWIRRLGGMPAVDKVYSGGENLDLPRQSYQKCSEDIIADLDMAISLLPHKWVDADQGRLEKCSAHALKGMVALYAASPLMQNSVDKLVERDDYSIEWATRAAQYSAAALDYIAANRPARMMFDPTGLSEEDRDSLYTEIFYHLNYIGKESLFCRSSNGTSAGGNARDREADLSMLYQSLRVSGRAGSWGFTCSMPTQNFIDAFEMADGTKFDWNNPAHAAEPYKNRDPRFYNFIIYPGRQWGKVGHPGTHDLPAFNKKVPRHGTYYFEPWRASEALGGGWGMDNAYSAYNKSIPTGYMFKKFWWKEAYATVGQNPDGFGTYRYNAEFIRTTGVWLDLAEALNEVAGPTGTVGGASSYTALDCVNKVRLKAGMPAITDPGSKEEFRNRIRNERRIELSFEYHRWFDIRRWMLFDEVFQGNYPIKGVHATLIATDGTENQENWTFEYEVIDIQNSLRGYELRNYWYPIPQSHMDRLYNIQQNPGW
ncbi:MAG: RagB/SusD family nutrient uptake outer membrane protein [Bacteroidales bacterium]|nr:RagB/SusD family nutrient uptake outer membrane protein [Bacteroidales bacterium]